MLTVSAISINYNWRLFDTTLFTFWITSVKVTECSESSVFVRPCSKSVAQFLMEVNDGKDSLDLDTSSASILVDEKGKYFKTAHTSAFVIVYRKQNMNTPFGSQVQIT